MSNVFGPVPSRRLGLSLGIDLIPPKTCTYDCLYCQVGKTTTKTILTKPYLPVSEITRELREKLSRSNPDSITLAGSGEPTLFSGIGRLIRSIKEMSPVRVALLTNGSLFWREEIRESVLSADLILPTLTSAVEDTFKRIHRPDDALSLSRVVSGLVELRRLFRGLLLLEVVLLAGMNDTEEELEALRAVIDRISPDKIQLNTVVRPPADMRAVAVQKGRLEEIRGFFGPAAEIVAENPTQKIMSERVSSETAVREMTKRRPLKTSDVSRALGLSRTEAEDLLKGLLMKGYIRRKEYSGETYYLSHEEADDD